MKSQYSKLYAVVFLTLMLAPLLSGAGTDTAQAQAMDPAQANCGQPEDVSVIDKLSPFDKSVIAIKATNQGLSPEEQEWHAEFLYKMKTGAPLDPDEQALADKLSPGDRDFFQKELPKFNNVPEDQLKAAWNQYIEEYKAKVATGQPQP